MQLLPSPQRVLNKLTPFSSLNPSHRLSLVPRMLFSPTFNSTTPAPCHSRILILPALPEMFLRVTLTPQAVMPCHNTLLILHEGTGVLFSSAPLVPTNPGNRTFFLLGSTREVIPLSVLLRLGKWPLLLCDPSASDPHLKALPASLWAERFLPLLCWGACWRPRNATGS